MSYNELIKNFDKIRNYMREFYIYGFKSRSQYDKKSSRSYDDERRRIESYLKDYISFRQTPEGKNVFISIDSRSSKHNPLYNAYKAKSFTDGDITLHFIIFDILSKSYIALSITEIMDIIDKEYLSGFRCPKVYDESTIRKKLKEYIKQGLITAEKQGRNVIYRRTDNTYLNCTDALDFYSEIAPCGVIGSYLLDKEKEHNDVFSFKHHYINHVMDSEILLKSFQAIRNKNEIEILGLSRKGINTRYTALVPLRVFISVQSGRQYLMTYQKKTKRIRPFRFDYIVDIKEVKAADDFDILRKTLSKIQKNIWGVSTQSGTGRMEHIEFTLKIGSNDEYIIGRLEREKRCGTVEIIDKNTVKFSADVFDSSELVPWIRTFICRISDIKFSNRMLQKQFIDDLKEMYKMYDLEEESKNDFQ